MTDEHILESLRVRNPHASQGDVDAARRFMRCFSCEDSETYHEAHQKILASMEMISAEMDAASSDHEARDIMRRRYANL